MKKETKGTVPLKSSYCSQFGTKRGSRGKNKKRHMTIVNSKKTERRPPQCVSERVRMSQLEKAAEAQQQSEESLGRGGRNGWNKEVVAERVGGGRKVLLLLLEKSSGGFVLYLVPWSGFEGGSVALVFAGR